LKILVLDNYDSFTYNLVHYIEGFDVSVDVVFNDEVNLDLIPTYDKIVLSPGPGLPNEAGKLMEVIERCAGQLPILGVCLGFQAIIEHFGGTLFNQKEVKHGLAEEIRINRPSRLFEGTADRFQIGLYHSWAAEPSNFPNNLRITGISEHNTIMAFEHKNLPICGVQFHPESILSQFGHKIVENFIFSVE
jgi:anthranilate synthase component 2